MNTAGAIGTGPAGYRCHPVHRSERVWTESNCYADLWIEVLHALGSEPMAMGYMLSCDFDGSQWTMFKPPAEDLRQLYGLDVAELNVWRPLEDHIEEQLARGRLLTVEVDAYHLPDTEGVSYRTRHVKTTIVPTHLDRRGRRLWYFHGAGYFELAGEDLDGIWPDGGLPPYVELVRLEGRTRAPEGEQMVAASAATSWGHLSRRPVDDPVGRLLASVQDSVAGLAGAGQFHDYAFGTTRQLGSAAELAAEHTRWLASRGVDGLEAAMAGFRSVAESAKELQFVLARAVARRADVDVVGSHGSMSGQWEGALSVLEDRLAAFMGRTPP